jgi:hypothetical protein
MPRLTLAQTSFTGGELSPRVLGHTDVDRYASGMKQARNGHPVVHGGFKRRAGFRYLMAAATNTAELSILVPFVVGRSLAFMLEFSNLSVRVLNADGTSAGITLTTPYSDSLLSELDWAQSDSTLYLFFPYTPIYRLQRLSATAWVMNEAPFTTKPFAETGFTVTTAGTLSLATVGAGRTLSVTSSTFLVSDIGRAVTCGPGIAVITAFTTDLLVTVEITRAFASTSLATGQWVVDSSPQTTCTPSAKDPVGATITLTLAANGWRAADVGAMVRINGGLCRITGYTSALIVNAVIVRELSGTTAAAALAWSLEPAVWGGYTGYPRTGTVFQQRLIAAGTSRYPRTVWGSRIGEPLDFELGTTDDLAFSFTIDGDEASAISYVSASKELAVFTESGEYSMRGGVEKPITPTNVRVQPESGHGCAQVRPVSINRETMFVQRAGRKVRGYGYRYDFDGFSSVDVTTLAEHITETGIVWLAYQQEPDFLLWGVRDDGKFVSCTIDRDQQPSVIGWALHETDGFVECVATIPNANADQVWAIVRRTINGSTVRYIERLDHQFEPMHPSVTTDGPVYGCTVDCGIVVDNAGGQTVFSVPHLAGETVDIVADGSKLARQTVSGAGALTLERSSKRTLIGLPFSTRGTLLNPEVSTQTGSAQGQPARTSEMVMRFLDTIGARVENSQGNTQDVPFRRFGPDILDVAPDPFTGLLRVSLLGWERGESEISVIQDDPYPMHLLSVVRTHQVNG